MCACFVCVYVCFFFVYLCVLCEFGVVVVVVVVVVPYSYCFVLKFRFLFGFGWGLLLACASTTVGTTWAFHLYRWLSCRSSFQNKLFFRAIDGTLNDHPLKIASLIRWSPINFGMVNFLMAMSSIP